MTSFPNQPKRRILIVDDEMHILQVLSLKLRNAGYDVLLAEDGEEALEVVLRERPDLVITDFQMPFMTGLEPGAHGVFDFTQKVPGEYRIRFTNATDRTGRSLFARTSDAGGRVLVLGMPAAFPRPNPNRVVPNGRSRHPVRRSKITFRRGHAALDPNLDRASLTAAATATTVS